MAFLYSVFSNVKFGREKFGEETNLDLK